MCGRETWQGAPVLADGANKFCLNEEPAAAAAATGLIPPTGLISGADINEQVAPQVAAVWFRCEFNASTS